MRVKKERARDLSFAEELARMHPMALEATDVPAKIILDPKGRRIILASPAEWPQARVVSQPIPQKKLDKPTVLVKRRMADLVGPRDEALLYLPGLSAISTFTGCGGMDLGIEAAGWCVLVQHEWDQSCCETLIGNRPQAFRWAALIQGDIRETPTSMLLSEAGLRVGETHLLTGGPPCQGFTTARGKRPAFDDRNDLVFQFLRVVREARPHFFIFENVPGFTNFNKGEYLHAFLEAAHDCYYELVYGFMNAVEYGVPQYRSRFICMGTRRDLAEIDGTLAAMPHPRTFFEGDLKKLRVVDGPEFERLTRPPGIRYFPDRPVLVPPDPIGRSGGGRSKSFYAFYDRLEWDEPDRLVTSPKGE